ncbi:hypothetical protein Tco_1393344 [Tanacetum coccineum]
MPREGSSNALVIWRCLNGSWRETELKGIRRSCKVRVGSNGNLLWESVCIAWVPRMTYAKTVFKDALMGHVEVYGYAFWVNQCTNGFHGVNEPSKEEYESHVKMIVESVKEEKMYVKFSNNVEAEQRGSYLNVEGIKWMLYRGVGRRSEARNDCSSLMYDDRLGLRKLINRWLSMKKDIASCGSKYLAYSEVEVEYQGSSGLLLQPETSMVDFRVLMPRVVKSRDEIFSRWGYCDNHDLSRLDNQSIERDRLIGIGFVLNFVKFISFTFGDKEMISVIEAVSFVRILRLREVARVTARIALEFAPEFVYVYRLDFVEYMPEDIKVPLILKRPFLSTARAKIDVYKRKITLRVGEERIVFTSVKPASSLIKRVYMLSLREIMELDLEARLIGETLVLNRSLDPFLEDYIELNDLNEPFELRRNQGDDLMPTIEEGEVIEEFKTRDDELDAGIDDYPSYCDYDKKIHIDYAHNLKFSCMIGFEFTQTNFFPLLYVNVMSKKFHNSIMKDKMVYKGNNVIGALMNVPIFVGTFSVVTDFAVLENMDDYRDEGMGDVSKEDKMNGISHPYQKLKGFYKGVLNLGPDYIRDAKMEEWLTCGHISVHEME